MHRHTAFEKLERRLVLDAVPQLVRDITPVTGNSSFASPLVVGDTTYFSANNGVHGAELWKTDGTAAGTTMVKDISGGSTGSSPISLVSLNGAIYFQTTFGLWKSDGTGSGTTLVKQLTQANTVSMVGFNGLLFFVGLNGSGAELWKSDGTADGTIMLKDINPGGSSSSPANFTVSNGILFFAATTTTGGRELWRTDGTAAGTVQVLDIWSAGNSSSPSNLTDVNGALFFTADDRTNGKELWKSDGTPDGTKLVKNIAPQSSSAIANTTSRILVNVGGILYFSANDAVNGEELWRSDGTADGTYLVRDVRPGVSSSAPRNLTALNNQVVFLAVDGTTGSEPWVSDGTSSGTLQLKDINAGSVSSVPGGFVGVGARLYFLATDATGAELWATDGTSNGTVQVKDIFSGATSSSPSQLINFNGKLLFAAADGEAGQELWFSDGSADGTSRIADINQVNLSTNFDEIAYLDGTFYFLVRRDGATQARYELWKSNGTAAGTVMFKDLGTDRSTVDAFSIVDGVLYYWVDLNTGHHQLWRSDGTTAGTVLVVDHFTGFTGGGPAGPSLFKFQGKLVFAQRFGDDDRIELWQTDGTAAGTFVRIQLPNSVSNLRVFKDRLCFTARSSDATNQLWSWDGTSPGWNLIKEYPSTASDEYWIGNITELDDILFFTVFANDTGLAGTKLEQFWTTDGTAAGSHLRASFNTAGIGQTGDAVSNVTRIGHKIFFTFDTPAYDEELWVYDSAAQTVSLVKEINPGPSGSSVESLTNVNGTLYFIARPIGNIGENLYKSDGTSAGTTLVAASLSNPSNLVAVNGTLYFRSSETPNDRLWKSDGTAAGTVRVSNVLKSVAFLTAVDGKLLFRADDGVYGAELWKVVPLVKGDLDRNGKFEAADLHKFLRALTDLSAYQTANQIADADLLTVADINEDGKVSNGDLQAFLNKLAESEYAIQVRPTQNNAGESVSASPASFQPTSSVESVVGSIQEPQRGRTLAQVRSLQQSVSVVSTTVGTIPFDFEHAGKKDKIGPVHLGLAKRSVASVKHTDNFFEQLARPSNPIMRPLRGRVAGARDLVSSDGNAELIDRLPRVLSLAAR